MHRRRYTQLKLEVESYQEQFNSLQLSFKLGKHPVQGLLIGACHDWCFQSTSPAFLKQIPSGVLRKYALWYNGVPKNITSIYNNIFKAARREGYDLTEKEELQH